MKLSNTDKYLIIMRGLPGSGKSTFIDKELKDISTIISPDEIRILRNGIKKDEKGREFISQDNPKAIWEEAFILLHESLINNQITVLDATSIRERELNKYKEMAENHKARLLIIDFTSISVEECKKRNANRMPEYKRVPEEVIDNMAKGLLNPIQGEVKNFIIDHKEFEDVE